MSEVYVVTNPELGWDCIVGVFNADSVSKEQLEEKFKYEGCYVVHTLQEVHKDLGEFQ